MADKNSEDLMASLVKDQATVDMGVKLNELGAAITKLQNDIGVYIGNSTVLTRLFTGQKIFVNTNDASEAPHLIFDGYWEMDITKAFMKIVRPGDTVFDIGSTFGYYGLIAGSITHSRGKHGSLHFFDPNIIYEPFVKKSLMVNGLIDASVINSAGVSGDGKPVHIQEFLNDWNSNTTIPIDDFKKYRKLNDDYVTKTVPTTTLDDYCTKHNIASIDVIKMDIEGMEQAAYAGAKKIIKASPRLKLIIEFTPAAYNKPKAFFASLKDDFDYLYTISQRGSLVPVENYYHLASRLRSERWLMMVASKVRV